MTETTNLKLKKPSYDDGADISVINDNMDVLDVEVNAAKDMVMTHNHEGQYRPIGDRDAYTMVHSKEGNVHTLIGEVPPRGIFTVRFKTADLFALGDIFLFNEEPFTAVDIAGKPLSDTSFIAGVVISCEVDADEKQLNFKLSGGREAKFNVFCQSEEPDIKDGIWLKSTEKISKIIFDADFYSGEEWLPGYTKMGYYMDRGCVFLGDMIYAVVGQATTGATSYTVTYATGFNLKTKAYTTLFQQNKFGSSYTTGNYYPQSGGDYIYAPGMGGITKYSISGKTATNSDLSSVNGGTCTVQAGDTIFFYGHANGTTGVQRYNMASTHAYPAAPPNLSYAVTSPSLGKLNNEIYIMGGGTSTNAQKTTVLNLDTNTNRVIESNGCERGAAFALGDELLSMQSQLAFNTKTLTKRTVLRPTGASTNGQESWKISNGEVLYNFGGTLYTMKLQSKSYSETCIVIKHTKMNNAYQASLYTDDNINCLPVRFEEAAYYKEGNVVYPPLYIGNGRAWEQIRS